MRGVLSRHGQAAQPHGAVPGTAVPLGTVWIEHWATTGHDELIERPVAEAVPLFWRFMIEKFAVDPNT